MKTRWHRLLVVTLTVSTVAPIVSAAAARNILLVTLDGLRWQEVFRGPDEAFFTTEGGGIPEKQIAAVRQRLLSRSPDERPRTLMPFLWSEIATKGQVFGNRDHGSVMHVANTEWFSYPGYNELLAGFADPLITSNAPIPNRNVTVLEWLERRDGFSGRVAACVTWHVHPAILNVGRSRLPVWVSTQNPALAAKSERFADIDRWMRDVPIKNNDEHYDAFAFHAAREMISLQRPRVLYVALGEPDTHAHARRYDHYVDSITRCDRFIRELWQDLQSRDDYRGNTTLIVTTDHGRGRTPKDWTNHGKSTPGSDETWLAVLGPDTPALGERRDHAPITSAQIAATIAAFVGEDFPAANPKAAPLISGVRTPR